MSWLEKAVCVCRDCTVSSALCAPDSTVVLKWRCTWFKIYTAYWLLSPNELCLLYLLQLLSSQTGTKKVLNIKQRNGLFIGEFLFTLSNVTDCINTELSLLANHYCSCLLAISIIPYYPHAWLYYTFPCESIQILEAAGISSIQRFNSHRAYTLLQ